MFTLSFWNFRASAAEVRHEEIFASLAARFLEQLPRATDPQVSNVVYGLTQAPAPYRVRKFALPIFWIFYSATFSKIAFDKSRIL